jgi:MtN3 and saliva related transmembrane protein
MTWTTALGFVAATLTTAAFFPQVLHTLRTKDTKGISLGMYVAFTSGVACWMVYGLLLGDWPITVANAITLITCCIVLALKVRHG